MRQRGFTLIELAIVLSVAAVMVPLSLSLARQHADRSAVAEWRLTIADGVTSLSEELRLDARSGIPRSAEPDDAVVFARPGCEVRYEVTSAGAVQRATSAGCGSPRGLARDVESIAWTEGGVEVVFVRRLRPGLVHHSRVFLPLETP